MNKYTIKADYVEAYDPPEIYCSARGCTDNHNLTELEIGTRDYIYDCKSAITIYLCLECIDRAKDAGSIDVFAKISEAKPERWFSVLFEPGQLDI